MCLLLSGWYSEINNILYQLSDPIFKECIIYLQMISMDYFDCIQSKYEKINQQVLKRLRHQLDPFTAVFRPVVSQLSSNFIESDTNDLNKVNSNENHRLWINANVFICLVFSEIGRIL